MVSRFRSWRLFVRIIIVCECVMASHVSGDSLDADSVISAMRHRLSHFASFEFDGNAVATYSTDFAAFHNNISEQQFHYRYWIDGALFRCEYTSEEVTTPPDVFDFVSTFDGEKYFYLKSGKPARLVRGSMPAFDFGPEGPLNPLIAPYAFVFMDRQDFTWSGLFSEDRWDLLRRQVMSVETLSDGRLKLVVKHPDGLYLIDVYVSVDEDYLPNQHVVKDSAGVIESNTQIVKTYKYDSALPTMPVRITTENRDGVPVSMVVFNISEASLSVNKPVRNVEYSIPDESAVVISDTDSGGYVDRRDSLGGETENASSRTPWLLMSVTTGFLIFVIFVVVRMHGGKRTQK